MKDDWEIKKLGGIAKISYGYTAKASFSENNAKFLRITDIQNNYVDWNKVPFCDIDNDKLSKYSLEDGDIVFARTGATTGKSFLIKNPPLSVFASYLIRVKILDIKEIVPEFLLLFFQTDIYWNTISKGISGSAQGGFNATKLTDIQIPLPPLTEQKKIVEILDEALKGIATIKANTERNLQNVRELFQSYLQDIFSHPGDDWEVRKLGEVCEIQRGGSPRPIKKFLTNSADGINWIKIGDAPENGKYINKTREKIKPEGVKSSRLVKDGDFILSNSMSFGRPYIMKTTGCIHDGWLVLSDREKRLNQDFLYYVLSSGLVYKQFDILAAGSTVRNLNINLVSQVQIPLPPPQRTKKDSQQTRRTSQRN